MKARRWTCALFTTVVATTLAVTLHAEVGSPIRLSLGSADHLRIGEPVNVIAVLEAGDAVSLVTFEVQSSSGWQVVDGQTRWAGAMDKGQVMEFRFRAVPLSDRPEALPATATVMGYKPLSATLDAERLGGRFPEQGRDESLQSDKGVRSASTADPVEAHFEEDVPLPEPMPATQPRIPGKPAEPAPVAPAVKRGKDRAASIVANGRFTYMDDNGIRRGVRNATVEVFNKNSFPVLDELCGRGITDGNGNFSIGGSCGDLFDGPDVFARIVLNNSAVEVKPDSIFAGSYTFNSARLNNSASGTLNFGTITITNNQGAYQAHNVVMRAHQFMGAAPVSESLPKVTVNWPYSGSTSFYNSVFKALYLRGTEAFGDEGVLYHEYGHHILNTKAESPAPNYANGNCDPGHCLYQPELGVIAWTEGWPNFFAGFMHGRNNAADGYGNTMMRFEARQAAFNFPGEEDHTEGIIAEILTDLVDTSNDDQREQGAGRSDATALTFDNVWEVIRNFDPSSDLFHNHPTSIHELYTGLRQNHLNQINNIAATYREAGIVKPQPDLEVTSVQNPPTRISRGTSFSNTNTVRNTGNERANNGFTVTFRLRNLVTRATVQLGGGSRTIGANLGAGSSNTASSTLTVPTNAALGTYVVQVCADSNGSVPEDDEGNNCRNSSGSVIVQ